MLISCSKAIRSNGSILKVIRQASNGGLRSSVGEALRVRYSTSSKDAQRKPYYVTSPIFYVNGAPHIGHLYTLVLADILKRWNALLGKQSILVTGTDEHGMKIQQAAQKQGKDVGSFCDEMHKPFRDLANQANIDYNHFIRTTEPQHRSAVQHFWLLLSQRDLIYSKKHEGWYSVSDETFYANSGVGVTLDPRTGRKHMASKETGKEVEWTSEINYHFAMSKFSDRLLGHYKRHPSFVIPQTRMKEVYAEVSEGLKDLSISRPRERLSWGIPVPTDETQTIYVWLDALINYLTKANWPLQAPGRESDGGWPADCHVVGKDIVRFHAIYWPAFLMALDLPLPRQVLTHAHWTLGRDKMSKSSGVAVDPFWAIDRFGTDAMRFYLAHEGGIKDDAKYDNSFIIKYYRSSLLGNLGNLTSRIMKGSSWNVRECVKRLHKEPKGLHPEFHDHLNKLPDQIAANLAIPDPREGLQRIMKTLSVTNAFVAHEEPWKVTEAKDTQRRDACIYLCAESLRICGILLQPYIPEKAKALLDLMNVRPDARSFDNTRFGCDGDYGEVRPDLPVDAFRLFPPLKSMF